MGHHQAVERSAIIDVMPDVDDGNNRTPSTTWGWRRIKIAPAPQAEEHRERSEASLGSLLRWPRRKPLTITLKYRGGAECWWEIRARGRTIRRPGYVAVHDLMRELFRDESM